MGKDSLIKSTTKRPKKKIKTTGKSSSNSTGKKSRAPRKQADTRKTKRTNTAVNNIIFRKFDSQKPPRLPVSKAPLIHAKANDSISGNDNGSSVDKSMRERLFRRFTMAEIQAAAQTKSIASQKTSYPVTDHNRYAPDTEDIGISTASPSPDPVVRFMAMGAAVIIGILIILVIASFMNSGKYYLVPGKDALEIWRGRFSPTGKSFDRVLHNYRLGSSLKPYYLKQEIYPIIFKYYLEKADDMLDLQGPTDFQGIVSYLNMAQQFALSDEMNGDITARMNTIKRITLLLKADVAINRGTHRSLELARRYLIDAKGLDPDAPQRKLIEEKLVLINTRLKKMSSPQSKSKNSQPQTAPAQGKSSK